MKQTLSISTKSIIRYLSASFLLLQAIALSWHPALAQETSCEQHQRVHHLDDDSDKKVLDIEILDYQQLIEESFVYRTKSIQLAKKLKYRIKHHIPLGGADLHALNEGLIAHLNLRKKLYAFAEMHECWLENSHKLRLTSADKLKGIMLSLSAALTLYDNYLLAISIYEEDNKLRRFLNSKDSGYNKSYDQLAEVTLSYNSISNRARVRDAIHHFERHRRKLSPRQYDNHLSYLDLLIKQSPSYKLTREYAPFRVLNNKLKFLDAVTVDTLANLKTEGVNIFSMIFGNTVGLIESRHGKLFNNKKMFREVSGQLMAGDILLEKTPFRLTDKFIPGHWGHAAIWIGTEQELRQLGIWEHPLVKKYQRQIRQGHSVVEALRGGVTLSTLDEFMNIDDLSILRLNKQNDKAGLAQAILLALRQIGKDYDFNFDIESTDKIVCSELIYVAYTNINWPTENMLGRYTISPDNIAMKAQQNGPLDLVMLIHNGKLISTQADRMMSRLLKNSAI